jgi:hypothetical protein
MHRKGINQMDYAMTANRRPASKDIEEGQFGH